MGNDLVTKLKNAWPYIKKFGPYVVIAVLAFMLGHGLKPKPNIEYRDKEHVVVKTEVQVKEQVVYKDRIVEKKVYVASKQKVQVINKDVVTTTDKAGNTTVVDKSTLVIGENTTVTKAEDKTKTVDLNKTTDVKSKTSVDAIKDVQVKETYAQSQWRVSADIGANFPNLFLLHGPVNVANTLVYGGSVERRILWGFWIGLWGNSAGIGGIKASYEFGAK